MPSDTQILESQLLVLQSQQGSRSAFDRLMNLWERPLFYYLRRLAPTEADAWDLLQETWLKVFRAIHTIKDPRTLPKFLYTTARNTALNRLRIPRNNESLETADNLASPDCAFIAFDDAEQVHHALDQLPLAQRETITLYFLQDLSIEEIAQVLGVSIGTVKSRLHYGKKTLRELLSKGECHAK